VAATTWTPVPPPVAENRLGPAFEHQGAHLVGVVGGQLERGEHAAARVRVAVSGNGLVLIKPPTTPSCKRAGVDGECAWSRAPRRCRWGPRSPCAVDGQRAGGEVGARQRQHPAPHLVNVLVSPVVPMVLSTVILPAPAMVVLKLPLMLPTVTSTCRWCGFV